MSNDLAVVEHAAVANWTPSFAVSVDEAVAQVQAKHEFFKRVMRLGDHYAPPHGVTAKPGEAAPKPTLLKPGAELLLANMGLQKELADADTPTIDYGGVEEGLIRYRRVCRIYRQIGNSPEERMLVAQAEGSCSSRESKYRWRNDQRVCPECGKPAIIKGKSEYGGGFVCFKKKDGCGAKFRDNDPAITAQVVGKVPNPDLADVENTILKMADKRALVAATLLATGCSDIFTQDMESPGETIEAEYSDTTPPAAAKVLTLDEMHEEIYGLFCALDLPPDRVNSAIEWASSGKKTDYKQLDAEEAQGLIGKLNSAKVQQQHAGAA